MRPVSSPLHALTWCAWAVSAAVCVQLAQNPVYVLTVIGLAALVVEAHDAGGPLSRAFRVLVALGVAFGLVRIVLTVLTVHGSSETLFTLPELTVPELLGGFTVGGSVESEVLAFAVREAIVIVGILAVFGAFNAVVGHDELVASLPRAFHEPGLVLTVGLAFVPATLASVRTAQEADKARTGGSVVRRGRLLRLAVPLLESGMERAMALAESMDARGFARDEPARAERTAGWLAFAGTLCIGGVLVALVGAATAVALGLLAAGAALLGGAVVLASRARRRTRYRRRRLGPLDLVVGGAAVTAAAGAVLLAARGVPLGWEVAPPRIPQVEVLPLAVFALLGTPALFPLVVEEADGPTHEPTAALLAGERT